MPLANERRIGIKLNSSIRTANRLAKKIEALLAAELGEGNFDIRTDGFQPPGWDESEVSISFRGQRREGT